MAVKACMVSAGVVGFGWSFVTSRTSGGEISVQGSDALDGGCSGEFNTVKENGRIHAKPVE